MSRWRRSVDELAARRRQHECERAQDALSRVTSCFQQLVALVGSSADGSFLRDELDETRAVAHRICSGLSCRLLRSLSNSDFAPSGVQDRQVLERLWVLFLSALEHFLYDLRKACDLIGQFPLTEHSNRRSLVNTGQLILVLMSADPKTQLNQKFLRVNSLIGGSQDNSFKHRVIVVVVSKSQFSLTSVSNCIFISYSSYIYCFSFALNGTGASLSRLSMYCISQR
uniref:Regulator of G protein signaling 9 binding protein n=1 Tax=Pundamilia nyererei TaxID=303518 RepID=A0A3B4FY99_9CICH